MPHLELSNQVQLEVCTICNVRCLCAFLNTPVSSYSNYTFINTQLRYVISPWQKANLTITNENKTY